jgi:arabinoxylan arabinofuranohydrolase
MIYNLVHFMGNRFAIYNYATKTAGGYVDIDFFNYASRLTALSLVSTTTR